MEKKKAPPYCDSSAIKLGCIDACKCHSIDACTCHTKLCSKLQKDVSCLKEKEVTSCNLYPLKTLPFSFFPLSSLIFSLSFSNSFRNVVILKAFSLRTWLDDPE
jgi:hypothetical protein